MELYKKVSDDLKGVKVKDYLKSIRTSREACRIVIYNECKTIEDVIKSAERVQKEAEFEKSMLEEENINFKRNPSYYKSFPTNWF